MLRALGQFPTATELADLMQRMDANQVRCRGWSRTVAWHHVPTAAAARTPATVKLAASHAARMRYNPQHSCIMHVKSTAPGSLCPQDGSICFEEFAAAMAGQEEDEETERQLREVRVSEADDLGGGKIALGAVVVVQRRINSKCSMGWRGCGRCSCGGAAEDYGRCSSVCGRPHWYASLLLPQEVFGLFDTDHSGTLCANEVCRSQDGLLLLPLLPLPLLLLLLPPPLLLLSLCALQCIPRRAAAGASCMLVLLLWLLH